MDSAIIYMATIVQMLKYSDNSYIFFIHRVQPYIQRVHSSKKKEGGICIPSSFIFFRA